MATAELYTEIALAELSHLVTRAGGDPATLDTALGMPSYFDRDDVLALGRRLAHGRLSTDPATVAAYFDEVGAVLAGDPAVTVVNVGPRRTVVYFAVPQRHVEIALVDGRALLTLRQGEVVAEPLTELTVVTGYRAGEPRRYLAVSPDAIVVSDDGKSWRAADLGVTTPAEALQQFVSR